MTRKIVEVGESLRLYLSYNDIDTGVALDPTTLVCTVTEPDGVSYMISYPSANFVREQAGSYFIRILTAQEGTHRYSVSADFPSGDKDVRDGKFDVEANW